MSEAATAADAIEQLDQLKMLIRTVYAPARLLVWPSRFHLNVEPKAADGHRHEYGNRSFVCENPVARKCNRSHRPPVERMDKRRAWYARMLADQDAKFLESFYDEEDSRDGLLYSSGQLAREGSGAR